jgi:YidC/Oxa1 family membrane protein insertase
VILGIAVLDQLETILRNVLIWLGPHGAIGLPWAWAIVALTVIVRILILPLAVKQIHSMQALQRFAPQMKEIQQKYKTDKAKQNEELMKFYKEHKINPAASCLPTVAQFPVFIALYFVLRDISNHPAELGTDQNLSWLHIFPSIADAITAHWSGYLLLVVYVVSQVASTYFMSTTMDKTQRRIMMVVPVFFVFFIARFPTGLVIYWVTTNLWTVGQGLVTRRLVPKTPVEPLQRRSSRGPAKEVEAAQPAPAKTQPAKTKPADPPAKKPQPQQPQARRVKRGRGSGRK